MENGAKPGYKTTEFWLSLAAVLVASVLSSGLENPAVLKAAGIIGSVLAAMGYTYARAKVKSNGG